MTEIEIIKGDITKLEVDAIVNAANTSLLGGGGVDRAIHRAAGPKLLEDCRTLNGCETGHSKITKGYNLPAKYVIHTVGPVYDDENSYPKYDLESCYITALNLAKEKGIKTIAFPAISCGVYGYPVDKASVIAIDTVKHFIKKNACLDKVIFIDINDEVVNTYKTMIDINKRCQFLPILNKHKVETYSQKDHMSKEELEKAEKENRLFLIYPKYSKEDNEWFDKLYDMNLIDYNYIDNTKKYDLWEKPVNELSRDNILTIFTAYVRQEKFCDGFWAEGIESGRIEELGKRLLEITKE